MGTALSVKKVPPNVARDVRSIANGEKDLDHPYYVSEKRKGTGKATCRQCHEVIAEGDPTVYFHYAPEDDNVWIRTRGTIHADDCEGGKDEWTRCPKCRKQVPRDEWSAHWKKEKGKKAAKPKVPMTDPCPQCGTTSKQPGPQGVVLHRFKVGEPVVSTAGMKGTVTKDHVHHNGYKVLWENGHEGWVNVPSLDHRTAQVVNPLKKHQEARGVDSNMGEDHPSLPGNAVSTGERAIGEPAHGGQEPAITHPDPPRKRNAFAGFKNTFVEKGYELCEGCGGNGLWREGKPNPCPQCEGSGLDLKHEPVHEFDERRCDLCGNLDEEHKMWSGWDAMEEEGEIPDHIREWRQGSKTSTTMYHISPKDRRESIEQHGLDYTKGEYSKDIPPGNYLYRTMDPPPWSDEWDVYSVNVEGFELNPDPDEPDDAVITPHPIPNDRIRRLTSKEDNPSPLPKGYQPRVDPYTQDALEETQKDQLDDEARKLQRNMKSLDQFAGFKSAKEKEKKEEEDYYRTCERCAGGGLVYMDTTPCEDCNGTGILSKDEANTDVLGRPIMRVSAFAGFKNTANRIVGWKTSRSIKAVRKRDWWNNETSPYSVCDRCSGSGKSAFDDIAMGRSKSDSCGRCDGSGIEFDRYGLNTNQPHIPSATGLRGNDRIHNEYSRGQHYPEQIKDCYSCKGDGKRLNYKDEKEDCYGCGGSGKSSYSDPRDFLEHSLSSYKGNKPIVGIQNNTGVHEDESYYHLRLHDTDILSFHKEKPEVSINWHGWDSVTTKQRTNSYLPHDVSIHRERVRPGKGYGNHELVVSTPTAAYKMEDGITVNFETGKSSNGTELSRCKECDAIREPDEMVKHQKRHDTYRKNFQSNPFKKCQSCDGSGSTKPWTSSCKKCKGTGEDWKGEKPGYNVHSGCGGDGCGGCDDSGLSLSGGCGNCRGSGTETRRAPDSGLDYMGRGKATGTCRDCSGAGKVMKKKPRRI